MKKLALFAGLLVALTLATVAVFAAPPRLYLTWTGSNSDPNGEPQYTLTDTFFVRSTGNPATPTTNWLFVTNLTYSTFRDANFRVEIPSANDQTRYYTVTVSNMFGESIFSAAVSTRTPMPPGNVGIGRF